MRKNLNKKLATAVLCTSILGWTVPVRTLAQTSGIDLKGIDRTVDPGDDFYKYANGAWLKTAEIPAVRTSYGVAEILIDEVSKRTAGLITDAGKSPDAESKLVADYYAAYLDDAAIEKRGLDPLKPELAEIAAIHDKSQLSRILGSELRADVDPLNATNFQTDRLFGVFISADFDNPTKNIPYLLQGGLGLPDRDFYLSTEAANVDIQAKYKTHIANILRLANYAEPDAKAARIFEFEKKIAGTHATREESEDVHKANNPWKMSDFSKKAPGIDWAAYFKAGGLAGQPMVMAWHPSAITGISALVASQPIEAWREYLAFHAIDRASGLLPKAFADEGFDFYGKKLSGVKQMRPRDQRAIRATSGALGDAVGKMYAKKYFPPEAKVAIQTLVKNIVTAFGKRIDALTWMTPGTRAKAKEKLQTLYVGVGYPDHWRSYAGLKISPTDALGNAQRISKFDYEWSLSKLKQPVDKAEWWMTPQTVNAVNLPLQNALNFPAAILSPPYFDPNVDPVENYGSIGATIGHEISHSFDDTGSQFDAAGRLQNWWTPADLEHFHAASQMLADQYSAYEPLPGLHLNGKQTLGENIADVAGLSASYDAYRAAYNDKEAPTVNGLTGDQRFFIAFAQSWREKSRPESLRLQVTTDGHSPDEFRGDTVRNLDAWYAAFGIKPGKRLYLAPEARVKVW